MDIPASRWYEVIPRRRSRRAFASAELEPSVLVGLRTVCQEFRPFAGVRAELVEHSADDILRGIVGSYGKVKGATTLIAFVGDMDDPHVQEKLGYTGEGIILEATAMGLATCWVGGFFRPGVAASVVGIARNEKVLAVTPVGRALEELSLEERTMTGFARSHQRRPLAHLVTGLDTSEWPEWVKSGLEAARLAPSATNRQPWRFHLERESITVSVANARLDFFVSKRLDCGIAMLHIEVAALKCGAQGRWELLQSPKVGRFTVAAAT